VQFKNEAMKVKINIDYYSTLRNERYGAMSSLIDWILPFPNKGDCIRINDDNEYGLENMNEESKKNIPGNVFHYDFKIYEFNNDEIHINLYFK
jgi:hypothetical protein